MQKILRFIRLGPKPVRGKVPPEDQQSGTPQGAGQGGGSEGDKAAGKKKEEQALGKKKAAIKAEPNPLVKLPLEEFIKKQTPYAWERLSMNIHPDGTSPGCVVASPSKALPDYWYQWTRDSAVCERVLVERFVDEGREQDWKSLQEYIEASRIMQHKETPSGGFETGGLGEVKFFVDCEPFTGPWGRPQPDGPGSRVVTLATLAIYLLSTGDPTKVDYVKRALYPGHPSDGIEFAGVVKADCEYLVSSWSLRGFDLWEEVSGRHFYTLLTIRTGLFLGARLASQLGDTPASVRYMAAADEIEPYLRRFWDDEREILRVTIDFGKDADAVGSYSGTADGPDTLAVSIEKEEEPVTESQATAEEKAKKLIAADDHGKSSELDVAVVLAVLHAGRGTSWSRITTGVDAVAEPPFETATKVLATLVKLMDSMAVVYPLNKGRRERGAAVALGRYPEDVYDGVGLSIAHPWYLCTTGAAEFLYLLVGDLVAMSRSPATTMLPLTPLLHSTLSRLLPDLATQLPAVNSALAPSHPAFASLVRGLIALGDSFVSVVQEFVGQNGHLSEQFERDGIARGSAEHENGVLEDSKRNYAEDWTGGEQEVEAIGRGARDLSWSYAAWITCVDERRRAIVGAERAGFTTAVEGPVGHLAA